MEWKLGLVAIQISTSPPDAVVHIVERSKIEPHLQRLRRLPVKLKSHYLTDTNVKTYCGYDIDLTKITEQSEKQEADVNCESCIAQVEKQQAYWHNFWRSSAGIDIIKMLSGYSQRERELKELSREFEALHRSVTELDDLLTGCLKCKEPIFTLELPDETLLKLVDYGSVGEILLAIRLSDDLRKQLKDKLEKSEIALLGSRLISKGYLRWNDEIFKDW